MCYFNKNTNLCQNNINRPVKTVHIGTSYTSSQNSAEVEYNVLVHVKIAYYIIISNESLKSYVLNCMPCFTNQVTIIIIRFEPIML